MKFEDVYSDVIQYWPVAIDISDGELLEGDGGFFKVLSAHWDKIEDDHKESSEWCELMIWSIYAGYHKAAVEGLKNGKVEVSQSDIDLEYVDSKFNESLDDPDSEYGDYQGWAARYSRMTKA